MCAYGEKRDEENEEMVFAYRSLSVGLVIEIE
jgi:hypothetical protein